VTVYELINIIKKRPEIYIKEVSLNYLRPFIDGYLMCQNMSDPSKEEDIYNGFQEYLQNHYKIITTKGWEDIIRFFATGEETAFENFYRLYEDYKLQCDSKKNK